MFENQRVAVAFCTPIPGVTLPNGQRILDTITAEWHRARNALAMGTNINFIEFFADRMEVGVARSQVAERCLKHTPRPEFLFFLDYDVLPDHDAFTKLLYRAKCFPRYDVFAGVYCCKWMNPADPLIYAGNGMGAYWDWAVGDLLTTEEHGITGTHMGLTLIRTSLFQRMLDAGLATEESPLFQTVKDTGRDPLTGCVKTRSGTEDLFFYEKAAKVGCKIMVDTSVLAGHIDKKTGITWGLPADSPPVQRAKWLTKKDREGPEKPCPACDDASGAVAVSGVARICQQCGGTGKVPGELKLALDIGAGGTRREWPGHTTYTTDIRADAKPDYVQDTRKLNLPDAHFDLVASSHHLEHLGRWDQEAVWAEMFRVLKPGGRMEHVVPSLDWAAHKLTAGAADEHVYNVLYGAQEAHGYAREFNLHYFGYTAAVAKELALACGLVDVEVRDWRQEPSLGYNLVITGRKPEAPSSVASCRGDGAGSAVVRPPTPA